MRGEVVNVEALERLQCLKGFPLFAELSAANLAVLAQYTEERFFRKNAVLLRPGEPVKEVHFIVEGRVRLRRGDAAPILLAQGEGAGLLGLLGRFDAGAEAIALGETLTLALDSATLVDILEDHFAILHHLIRSLSGLLSEAHASAFEREPTGELHVFGNAVDLDLVARIFVLRGALPFARENIPLLATLARVATDLRRADGEAIWAQGDMDGGLLFVAKGSVSCTTQEGERVAFGPGSCPGACEAIAGVPRWCAAHADGELVGLRVDAAHLIDVFEDDTEAGMAFLAMLARQLTEAPCDAAEGRPSFM